MKTFATTMKKFWNDESGQGMLEYVLLAVLLVGAIIMFKGKFMTMISSKTDDLNSAVGGVTASPQ